MSRMDISYKALQQDSMYQSLSWVAEWCRAFGGWKNTDWWGASYWQNDTWYKGHCALLSCAPANLGYEMVHTRRQMRGLNSFLLAYQESAACVWVKARGS